MFWLLLIPLLLYGLGLIYISQHFHQHLKQTKDTNNNRIPITIIIAARNEEARLENILSDLQKQILQGFEIIVVDDHSDDQTVSIAASFEKVKVISNVGQGKKAALTTAMASATGEIILVTDADCRVGPNWVEAMTASFYNNEIGMVCGPVRLHGSRGILSQLQYLEFHSLIVLGASFIRNNKPFFCNAACMGFRKALFEKVGGYAGNENIPSGDDEYLMQKIHQYATIYFESHPEAMVKTGVCETWRDYIHQRVRWASKHSSYKELYKKMTIMLFGLVNLEMLLMPLWLFLMGPIALWLFLLKMGIDGSFARYHSNYFRTIISITSLPMLVCCYPWLLLRISLQRIYVWKGRQLS